MKSENKLKRKIGAFVILSLFLMISIASPVSAEVKLEEDDTKVSVNDAGGAGGYISWHLDATENMRLTSGRLGIGDTSPDFKLEVTGSSGSGYFGVTTSNDGDIFKIDSSGNVGIGIASPIHKLHISDSDTTTTRAGLYVSQSGAPAGGNTLYGTKVIKTGSGPGTNVAGYFSASGSTSQKNYGLIVEDGSVGIGVTDPAEKLEIDGNIRLNDGGDREMYVETRQSPGGDGYDLTTRAGHAKSYQVGVGKVGGYLYLRGGDGDGEAYGAHGGDIYIYGGAKDYVEAWDGDVILAHTGSTARGNVYIGTTTLGTSRLTVKSEGSTSVYYGLKVQNSGGTDQFVVRSDGNIGIGTTSPTAKLTVDGDIAFLPGSTLEITDNEVTVTHSVHAIDNAEGNEDLNFIDGGVAGQLLFIRSYDTTVITVKHDAGGAGEIILVGGSDFILNSPYDTLFLAFDGNRWIELFRTDIV